MNDCGWIWLHRETVLAIHDEQIAEHGGLPGVRDMTLVESALARPRDLAAYGTPERQHSPPLTPFGLARNHGFSDGNKRTAYVTAVVFLLANGWDLTASDTESVETILLLAAGGLEETALADWFRHNMKASDSPD